MNTELASRYEDNVQIVENRFKQEVMEGLQQSPKKIPSKYFYDVEGSKLFEQICGLKEYYLTRTETSVLEGFKKQICNHLGPECLLVELGSGSSTKTRTLLDGLKDPAAYIPMDISFEALSWSTSALQMQYPNLEVLPVCTDYTDFFQLPMPQKDFRRRVFFFPGSTIGNFTPKEASAFLKRIRPWCKPEGGMLIGFDRVKNRSVMEAAYNDSEGVTARFNLNLLERIARELDTDLDPRTFEHRAVYNEIQSRIEMHLVSRKAQDVTIEGQPISFEKGESILTEVSYKYHIQDFTRLVQSAGFYPRQFWTDRHQWFSICYLTV